MGQSILKWTRNISGRQPLKVLHGLFLNSLSNIYPRTEEVEMSSLTYCSCAKFALAETGGELVGVELFVAELFFFFHDSPLSSFLSEFYI